MLEVLWRRYHEVLFEVALLFYCDLTNVADSLPLTLDGLSVAALGAKLALAVGAALSLLQNPDLRFAACAGQIVS